MKNPKVDNLKHISDHGVSVKFACPKLAAWVDSFASVASGEFRFTAGKSSLSIIRKGDVTYTRFHKASSGYGDISETIHYYSAEGLKTRVTCRSSDLFNLLNSVIFGASLDSFFTPNTGAGQDDLRRFYSVHGWALFGENGLRAFAMEDTERFNKSTLANLESRLRNTTEQVERFEKRDLSAELAEAKKAFLVASEKLQTEEKTLDACTRAVENRTEQPAGLQGVRTEKGEYNHQLGRYEVKGYFFPAVSASFSVPVCNPNYTATLGEDFQTIKLSSGIVCPITYSQALGWLKGDPVTLKTDYGVVTRENVCDSTGKPYVVIKAGCHRLDCRALGGEVAELLAPTHTVQILSGSPQVNWDATPGAENADFWARALACQLEYAKAEKDRYRAAKLQYLQRAKCFKTLVEKRDTVVASYAKDITEQIKAVVNQKAAMAAQRVQGATLAQLKKLVPSILCSLQGRPFVSA
jgi:hypothetical protein